MIELTTWRRAAIGAGALVLASAVGASILSSCAATPTSVPIQSFQRPQDVDVVCLHVYDANGHAIVPAQPVAQAFCAPVPTGATATYFQYHLYALVTQTTTGEVALVDLTGQWVVDEDPGTPGTNFLPVGTLPSDIVSTPDGVMSFVGSASPNAPAIYALPSTIILGDSQGAGAGAEVVIPKLTTWPSCSLPQAPGALAVVPVPTAAATADGGTASEDGGAAGSTAYPGPGYVLVAVLPGDSVHPAAIATIDPAPLMRGAGKYVDLSAVRVNPSGESVAPGSLAPCPVMQVLELSAPPSTTMWSAGPAWEDGVKYVDGGVDADLPANPVSCVSVDAGPTPLLATTVGAPTAGSSALDTATTRPILYVADTQLPIIHVIDVTNPSAPVELAPLLATSLASPGRTVSVGKISVSPSTSEFKRFLYAIDQTEGSVMVYDITDPSDATKKVPLTRPHPEIDPFQPPDRLLFGAPVAALSFAVHDWPLQAELTDAGVTSLLSAQTGLICNPNPAVDPTPSQQANDHGFTADNGPFSDPGAYYRANANNQPIPLGPSRLRGVFAFMTLSNGEFVAVDVDDWDGPCRRPDPMVSQTFDQAGGSPSLPGSANPLLNNAAIELLAGPTSAIAPPQSYDPANPADPYHAPFSYQTYDTNSPVSGEFYFPVSAPHRIRSDFFLSNTTTYGTHAPSFVTPPQLYSNGAPIATQGDQSIVNPSIVPTDTPYVDPTLQSNPDVADPADRTAISVTALVDAGDLSFDAGLVPDDAGNPLGPPAEPLTLQQSAPGATPGVRFAWEDPVAQIDQSWVVDFEGELPGFYDSNDNPLVVANVVTPDGGAAYQTLSLLTSTPLCNKGIEDFALGAQRADAENAALAAAGLPTIPNFDQRVSDYVQLADQLRASDDNYWNQPNACWSEPGVGNIPASQRYNECQDVFGWQLDPTTPSTARDFPILEAYDDHLVIGRFGYPNASSTTAATSQRQVVGADPSNVPSLALMQCCFSNQVHFNVRTGQQWSAVGSVSGFLHHIVASGSDDRCVSSCDERTSLLNGRAAPIPRPATQSTATASCPVPAIPSLNRDSVLALRNPMFSFLIWNGQDATNGCADITPIRDLAWRFSTQGQISPQELNLAAGNSGLSPQSMKFIDSLGQIAVIDGESQGLILIDLGSFSEAHSPYF